MNAARRLGLCVAAVTQLFTAVASAQTARGQVKDRVTGKPALGVVTMVDTGGVVVGRTPTGPQGQYVLTAPAAGAYRLQFLGPGYGPHISPEFSLAPGETRIQGIEVTPLPAVPMDTVIVEGRPVPRRLAGFYERQATGTGQFISREDLERSGSHQPTDVFRRLMGVTVVPSDNGNRVLSRRGSSCAPAVFLDGIYMGTGAEFDFDAVLTTEQIEGVESYAGSGQIPPEFNRGDCGVLVIWTRVAGPGTVATATRFDLAADAGGWISSSGFQQGRVGVRGVIGVGIAEIVPTVHVLVPGFRSASAQERSGTEVQFTLRARPLGPTTPWYAGFGVTFLDLSGGTAAAEEDDFFLLLAGASLPRGLVRPFAEVQVLGPFTPSRTRAQVFVGGRIRVY